MVLTLRPVSAVSYLCFNGFNVGAFLHLHNIAKVSCNSFLSKSPQSYGMVRNKLVVVDVAF